MDPRSPFGITTSVRPGPVASRKPLSARLGMPSCLRRLRVLVIEDDLVDAVMIPGVLQEDPTIDTRVVAHLQQANGELSCERFEAVLLSMDVARTCGLGTCISDIRAVSPASAVIMMDRS